MMMGGGAAATTRSHLLCHHHVLVELAPGLRPCLLLGGSARGRLCQPASQPVATPPQQRVKRVAAPGYQKTNNKNTSIMVPVSSHACQWRSPRRPAPSRPLSNGQ
eukprot:COSAG01_NODE_4523_length_4954_cov_116.868795_4_plen_105_part_00